jgi:dihydrofolate reductase
MGRKTFESIGKPLPGRRNIVVSRTMAPREGVEVCEDIPSALARAQAAGTDVFVIGGAQIYEQTMGKAQRLYLTHIEGEYEGDARFPEFDEREWTIIQREDRGTHAFVIYERRTPCN